MILLPPFYGSKHSLRSEARRRSRQAAVGANVGGADRCRCRSNSGKEGIPIIEQWRWDHGKTRLAEIGVRRIGRLICSITESLLLFSNHERIQFFLDLIISRSNILS